MYIVCFMCFVILMKMLGVKLASRRKSCMKKKSSTNGLIPITIVTDEYHASVLKFGIDISLF